MDGDDKNLILDPDDKDPSIAWNDDSAGDDDLFLGRDEELHVLEPAIRFEYVWEIREAPERGLRGVFHDWAHSRTRRLLASWIAQAIDEQVPPKHDQPVEARLPAGRRRLTAYLNVEIDVWWDALILEEERDGSIDLLHYPTQQLLQLVGDALDFFHEVVAPPGGVHTYSGDVRSALIGAIIAWLWQRNHPSTRVRPTETLLQLGDIRERHPAGTELIYRRGTAHHQHQRRRQRRRVRRRPRRG